MKNSGLFKAAAILLIIIAATAILFFAKEFLIPIAFGGLISMVLLPVTKWLQSKGLNKALSILISIVGLVALFALVIYIISWQVSDVLSNTSEIEKQFTEKKGQVQQYLSDQFGISQDNQQEMMKKQQESSSGNMSSMVTGIISGVGGFLTNTIVVLVYIFLFLYFRDRIRGFILRLVNKEEEQNANKTIDGIQQVAQKYIGGLGMMILILWVMYGIGFTIAGVKNAFFFAIICGILEIVPFIGNIAGTAITIIMSMVQGGSTNLLIGILITYAVVQFIQTYLIEPLVVGSEVSINPLFTILALIAGEIVWGIPGMIMAIPLLGMLKIVCDHVEPLKPYAYLIGSNEKKKSRRSKQQPDSPWERIKSKFS